MKRIHLPLQLSREDYNQIVDKANSMGLPPEQILGHLAPQEEVPRSPQNTLAFISSAAVIIVLSAGWIISAVNSAKFHTLLHHKGIELAKMKVERDALAEQLEPVGLEALLVGVLAQVNPARLDDRGRNHIAVAMRKGDIALAEYWEGRGVSWNQPVWYGKQVDGTWTQAFDAEGEPQVGVSPIMIAARRGHFQVIRYMLNPVRRDKIDWGFSCHGGQTLADILNEHIILYPNNKQLPVILSQVEIAIEVSGGG